VKKINESDVTFKQDKKLRLNKITIARLDYISMRSLRAGGAIKTDVTNCAVIGATEHCTEMSACCPPETTGDIGITPCP